MIVNVPESITRADYLRLIESVGFDVKELRQLEFRVDGVYAVLRAKDADGRILVDVDPMKLDDRVAEHRVFIPVRD